MSRDQRTRKTGQGTGALDPAEAAIPAAPTAGRPTADDASEPQTHDEDAPEEVLEVDDAEEGAPPGDDGAPLVLPPDAPPERVAAEEPLDPETPREDGEPGTAPDPAASEPPTVAAITALAAPAAPDRSTSWGILCRVVGPGSVAGHGIRLDGRPAHFWRSGARGYFSQAAINKLPQLLIPESS